MNISNFPLAYGIAQLLGAQVEIYGSGCTQWQSPFQLYSLPRNSQWRVKPEQQHLVDKAVELIYQNYEKHIINDHVILVPNGGIKEGNIVSVVSGFHFYISKELNFISPSYQTYPDKLSEEFFEVDGEKLLFDQFTHNVIYAYFEEGIFTHDWE
jgi:hypothetical protein